MRWERLFGDVEAEADELAREERDALLDLYLSALGMAR